MCLLKDIIIGFKIFLYLVPVETFFMFLQWLMELSRYAVLSYLFKLTIHLLLSASSLYSITSAPSSCRRSHLPPVMNGAPFITVASH